MRLTSLILAASVFGCVPVYDAQLSDRREELEENREEFLSAEERVQFKLGGKTRFWWVGLGIPLNENVLRSFDATGDGTILTYAIPLPTSSLEDRLAVGDQLVAICPGSGNKTVFDATQPNLELSQTMDIPDGQGFQGGTCQASGSSVYFVRSEVLFRWDPPSQTPVVIQDLATTGIGGGTIAGFAIEGDRMVFAEGGRLWLLDLNNPATATWLMNDSPPEGNVVINERGVLYRNGLGRGAFFVSLPDLETISLDDRVETGGYRLNALHDAVHLVDDRQENALFGDQVIYRAEGGIFAYGLDTRKVQDILLDSEEVRYFDPVVLQTGDLFVEQRTNSDVTVFRVQLNDVLR